MNDYVVPPSSTEFARRLLPRAVVHMMPEEGHFSYFWLCDDCHWHILSILFGDPQGPLANELEIDESVSQECMEETTWNNSTEQE